jgi:hypothetical protein
MEVKHGILVIITKKSKDTIVTLADGINQSVESIEIKDSQATSAVNVDSFL